MDCKYFVKIVPFIKTDSDNNAWWVFHDYHKWLRENNISRYRGGDRPQNTLDYRGQDLTFRFADKEDVMAFKLAWI